MNKGWRLIGVLALIFLVASDPLAQTSKGQKTLEADSLLTNCDTRYKSGDYKNALKSCYLAKKVYEEIQDRYGISQANLKINTIEGILSPNQLAEIYYRIAADYYLEPDNDVKGLEMALVWAKESLRLYDEISGETGVSGRLKCEDMIRELNRAIEKSTSVCKDDADLLYDKAKNSFFLNDYVAARNYAMNASAKYAICPYNTGVILSSELISSINLKMRQIRGDAKAAYDQAIKFYSSQNFDLCVARASESVRLYTEIGESDGLESAASILSECTSGIEDDESKMRKEADKYLKDAEMLSIIPDCQNSTRLADRSLQIYQELYNRAQRTEKDLPEKRQTKSLLYQSLMYSVKQLKSRIQETCSIDEMNRIANQYYRQSQDFYLQNKLNDALAYAINSRNIYDQLRNYVGIEIADTLISQIQMRMSQINEAETYLENAIAWKNSAKLEEAMHSANRAYALYQHIDLKNKVAECEELFVEIRENMKKLESANNYLFNSRGFYEAKDFENANSHARVAFKLFTEVNDTLGISESGMIVKDSQERLDELNASFRNKVIFIGAIVAISGFLLYQINRKKSVMEAEIENKRKVQETESRRRREELEIRSMGETQSKVEAELRRLIDEERDKVD